MCILLKIGNYLTAMSWDRFIRRMANMFLFHIKFEFNGFYVYRKISPIKVEIEQSVSLDLYLVV